MQWIIFFLLLSCSISTRWHVTQTNLGKQQSSHLFYNLENPYLGVQLEFLRIGEEISGYLYVKSRGINKEQFRSIPLEIAIENENWKGMVLVYEGGQKFKLDDETTQLILKGLLKEKTVSIRFSRYTQEINGDHFTKKYQEWMRDSVSWSSFLKKMF